MQTQKQRKSVPLTVELLKLTEQPYDNYNDVLAQIKTKLLLDVQVRTFEQVLTEELPLTTARRAFRTAIRIAMGEQDVYREPRPFVPQKPAAKPKKK
jgi:hypothetical protein